MSQFDAIAIFATMRSGSNYLEKALGQHPRISVFGELFNPHFIGRPNVKNFGMITLEERTKRFDELLAFTRAAAAPNIPIFRIFNDHDPLAQHKILTSNRIAKIILRRNAFDGFVSLEMAERTQQWKLDRQDAQSTEALHFDPKAFDDYRREQDRYYDMIEAQLATTRQEGFFFDYDDIFDIDKINAALAFCALKPPLARVIAPTKQQLTRNKRDLLSNPQDVRPDWLPKEKPIRAKENHSSVINRLYIADRIELAFAPISGTNEAEEIQRLKRANRGSLRKVDAEGLAKWIEAKPGRICYANIMHPAKRAYLLFCAQLYGINDGFQGKFPELVAPFLNSARDLPNPAPKTPDEAKAMELKPYHYKRLSKAYMRLLRNELWGFKQALAASDFWPQTLLLDNFRQFAPITAVIEHDYPAQPQFEALRDLGRPKFEMLNAPFPAERFLFNGTENILRECYREDFEDFGFTMPK